MENAKQKCKYIGDCENKCLTHCLEKTLMENAKQKAIRLAYREYWKQVKDYVDENGWAGLSKNTDKLRRESGFEWSFQDVKEKHCARPKSLQGIETNNNWIKIESEEQIKYFQNEFCWVYFKSGELEKIYIHSSNYKFLLNNCTHYQPIVKPLKPIY